VLAVVVEAVLRIGRRALKNRVMQGVAAAAFIGIFLFGLPFPIIIVLAGLTGWIGSRRAPWLFTPAGHGGKGGGLEKGVIDLMFERGELTHADPSWRRAVLFLRSGCRSGSRQCCYCGC
jgi:chromate transporter